MIVVSGTTVITTLLKCGEERLLQQLFGTIIIPQHVGDELLQFHAELPTFISVRQAEEPQQRLAGTERLGRGEAEALNSRFNCTLISC